jgi:hypothetical protein
MLPSERRTLISALDQTRKDLDDQILQVGILAREMGCLPREVQSHDGGYLLTPLLVSKVQVLCALVDLKKE